jgi:hypothetical protein
MIIRSCTMQLMGIRGAVMARPLRIYDPEVGSILP